MDQVLVIFTINHLGLKSMAFVSFIPLLLTYALGFASLAEDRYDLVIAKSCLETPEGKGLLRALADERLRAQLNSLPGYDAGLLGQVIDEALSQVPDS